MATITATHREGTEVIIRTRQFTWRGDEPVAAGGADSGPTPYEMLLGSLAACIAITLRLYSNHKGIDLDGVDVHLEFDRVHADDCLECDEQADGWIDRIRTEVSVHGDFDEAQQRRLAQVARRCPVHRTLAKGVEIFDSVAFDG